MLEANVPLLASNVLLENLGMVLDMPRSSATFATLGVTVPVFRVNGHLAISVVQFSTTDASEGTSWKALQESVDWSDPPPELVLLARDVADIVPAPASAPHAAASTVMDAQLAPPGALASNLQADGVHLHGPGGEPRPRDDRDLPQRAPGHGRPLRTSSIDAPAPRLCPVRQRVRQVCSVQAVSQEVEVEGRPRRLDRAPRQQVRHFAAQFATAFALLLQHCVGAGGPAGGTIDPEIFYQAGGSDYQGGSFAEAPGDTFSGQRLGHVGRMEPSEQPPAASRERLRLGRRRRLAGDWKRSAGTLEQERVIYDSLPVTAQRPPPCVDIMELFAGEAGITSRASSFGLSASEPIDQVYGWHLEELETQSYVINMIKRLRPHVLHVAYPCTLYSIFNENFTTTASACMFSISFVRMTWRCAALSGSFWTSNLDLDAPSCWQQSRL